MARSPGSKSITDNADATDLFFHGFLLCCWISLRLSGAMIVTDYLLLEESCAVQAQIQSERNPLQYTRPNKRNPWKDKIRRIGYLWTLWARADWAEGEGAQQCGTVFQTALFSLVINPETFSRVTLALLGIVFQTKQFTTDTHLCFSHFYQLLIHIIYTDALFCYLWLPWSVAIRFGWKPIPSEARVTRDAVSGLTWYIKQLSGRQYLTQWKMKKEDVVKWRK